MHITTLTASVARILVKTFPRGLPGDFCAIWCHLLLPLAHSFLEITIPLLLLLLLLFSFSCRFPPSGERPAAEEEKVTFSGYKSSLWARASVRVFARGGFFLPAFPFREFARAKGPKFRGSLPIRACYRQMELEGFGEIRSYLNISLFLLHFYL